MLGRCSTGARRHATHALCVRGACAARAKTRAARACPSVCHAADSRPVLLDASTRGRAAGVRQRWQRLLQRKQPRTIRYMLFVRVLSRARSALHYSSALPFSHFEEHWGHLMSAGARPAK